MTVSSWLKAAAEKFDKSGITSSRLDCMILLEDLIGHDRSWLLAHPEYELSNPVREKLTVQLADRLKHVPLAYIRGKTEFYGREFLVTPATLEPRPETETMLALFKNLGLPDEFKAADIGTGSGAIGISLALDFPASSIDMFEINQSAIKIARRNISKHAAANCHVHAADILPPKFIKYAAILANLPYVPDDFTINKAAMQEPAIAIFGGSDGLDLYRRLFDRLGGSDNPADYVLTEALPFQHQQLADIANSIGYKQIDSQDFIQVFKLNQK